MKAKDRKSLPLEAERDLVYHKDFIDCYLKKIIDGYDCIGEVDYHWGKIKEIIEGS